MQTFIPEYTPERCALVLDNKRLVNQVNEALIIYRSNTRYYKPRKNGSPGGWWNHPATKMWRGHDEALLYYRNAMIQECENRGIVRNFTIVQAEAHRL